MNYNSDDVDELFRISTPKEINTSQLSKYFSDVDQAVREASRAAKYEDDNTLTEYIATIDNELSWVHDDVFNLIDAYETAMESLSEYRDIVMNRLTEDEVYDLNTLSVRRRLERST